MTTYASSLEEVKVISTGLFLDNLVGVGGIPLGKITEVFGDPSSGKSTLCMQIVASAQKQGLKCLFADAEWSYTPRYASDLGVSNEKLGIVRERCAEDILDALEREIEGGKWDLVVLDSVGGLTPRAEIEKGADGKVIGGQASLLARFCRKIVPLLEMKQVALIMVNHSFTDIMSGRLMTSGGAKLNYHKSLSIRLKYKGIYLKSGEKKVGKVITAEVKKNKLAGNEGAEISSQFVFGKGFSATADLLQIAIDKGVITKQGNSYYFGEVKLGVGMDKTRKALEADEDLQAKIKDLLVN